MWETFGPTCELEHWAKAGKLGDVWCWDNTEFNMRLYFFSDKELNWYKLKWGV